MKEDSPLKSSIQKRLEEERYVIPKEKKKRRSWFNLQYILVISILISLLMTVLRILTYF